ncbi:hypothetical protein [Corynebacterium sp. Marseille-P4321]|uniref:hypothetical protein n=1 Tax=Corynebacterium sp. Marseille-P4321 TaxID=2736603 RepID=UPI00158E4AF4|nr:hypothetical protein [Corynebacterium sp. Marseille-P4321]
MTTPKDKTPAAAPTTTRAQEKLEQGISAKNDTAKPVELHLPNRTNGRLDTWGECDILQENRRTVFVDVADYLDMSDGARSAQLCPACVDAAVAHSEQEKRKEEERLRRQKETEEAQQRRVRELEMHYELVDAYRAGDTEMVTKLLDELLAEDDATLARLGISSWDEVNDDE